MNEQHRIEDQSNQSVWPRVLYMILFAIAFSISETVLFLVAVVNLVFTIVKKETHKGLVSFGASLAKYLQQIASYLTFNTEYLPFPFNNWPSDMDVKKDSDRSGDTTPGDEEAHA